MRVPCGRLELLGLLSWRPSSDLGLSRELAQLLLLTSGTVDGLCTNSHRIADRFLQEHLAPSEVAPPHLQVRSELLVPFDAASQLAKERELTVQGPDSVDV